MTLGRVIGLDYGERRVGIAISDALRLTAQPHDVVDVAATDFGEVLSRLIDEYEVDLVVVGLPTGLAGTEGDAAAAARRFGAEVAAMCGLPVEFYDERFSSVVAERALLESGARRQKRRSVRDKLAAAVMLQSYLDRTS